MEARVLLSANIEETAKCPVSGLGRSATVGMMLKP